MSENEKARQGKVDAAYVLRQVADQMPPHMPELHRCQIQAARRGEYAVRIYDASGEYEGFLCEFEVKEDEER